MDENTVTSDIIRGHINTIILKLLYDGDKYGYQICKMISTATNGQYELKEATMYSSLKRLENDQSIESYWGDETQGGRRKYYKITEKGKDSYVKGKANWEYAKSIIEKLI